MKYAFMQDHSGEFKITSMSRVLGVSRSGFYRFRQRRDQPTKRQQERMGLDKLVADAEFIVESVAVRCKCLWKKDLITRYSTWVNYFYQNSIGGNATIGIEL